jgi:hypothetical protein
MNSIPYFYQHTASIIRRPLIPMTIVMLTLLCSMTACSFLPKAPRRLINTPLPELSIEIIELPERVCLDQAATFVVKTTPGNECSGVMRYPEGEDVWKAINLKDTVADQSGLCRWSWQVPQDAIPGTANFRAVVSGYGDSESMVPKPFGIENCGR